MRIDRLSLDARGLIFSLVKSGYVERERTDTVNKFTHSTGALHPSTARLYALEQYARRERARAQARLIMAAASAVKRFLVRGLAFFERGPSASNIQRQVAHHA
jgi:hypothetical protein